MHVHLATFKRSENRGTDYVRGVFTWAVANRDTPDFRKDQLWFDIGGSLAEFGSNGILEERMRSVRLR